jgi:hypothetical protein
MIVVNTDPTGRQLQQFGLIWLAFFGAAGALAYFRSHAVTAALVLWALAVVVPAVGWTAPRFMRLVYVGMSYLAWPIGFVVSHLVLAAVYYLVLTPIGLFMRLLGHDPMARRFDPTASSYWHRRPETHTMGPGRYFRQF